MGSNKNFEAYATSLFGQNYSEKKAGKVNAPWTEEKDIHPEPFDIVVVDNNDKVLKRNEKEKHKTGIGKSSKMNKKSSFEEGRMTPVIIDMNESPLDDGKTGSVIRKRRKAEKKEHDKLTDENLSSGNYKEKKQKSSFERVRFEADDSGISLNGEGEEGLASEAISLNMPMEHVADRHEDSGSDSDLAYFCVDHMKMCKSRNELRKHRKCNLDYTKSVSSSPVILSSRSPHSRERKSAAKRSSVTMTERRPSALFGESQRISRVGGGSSAAFLQMQTMYKETLEKLYNYSGVMMEDRQSLKEELRNKKLIVQEKMMDYMEELLTRILKLKSQFLDELESKHKRNILSVRHQIERLSKMKDEIQSVWQTLQLPKDYDDFEEYKKIIEKTTEKSDILHAILKNIYESSEHYEYKFESTPEVIAFYDQENIAYVDDINVTPLLPPFLTVRNENEDGESLSDITSLKSLEGFENVSGKHESGNESGNERCCFTGCTYILDDAVLLVDWSNGCIKMLNNQGLVADSLVFEHNPWDVAQNSNGQVAVTVPKLQTVFLVEAEPHLRIVEQFKTRCDCFGICKIRENYAITCDPWSKSPSLRVFDKLGHTLLKVQTDAIGENYFKCPLHVCSDFFNTVIYVSDATADCVYAISVSGEIIFCYNHDNLEYPTGVETDRNNMMYVCGKASSNIHKLSNDGSLQELLLKANDGVQSPCAIAFHQNGDHLILTDLEGEKSSGYWKLNLL